MEDINGWLHSAVDGQSLDERRKTKDEIMHNCQSMQVKMLTHNGEYETWGERWTLELGERETEKGEAARLQGKTRENKRWPIVSLHGTDKGDVCNWAGKDAVTNSRKAGGGEGVGGWGGGLVPHPVQGGNQAPTRQVSRY